MRKLGGSRLHLRLLDPERMAGLRKGSHRNGLRLGFARDLGKSVQMCHWRRSVPHRICQYAMPFHFTQGSPESAATMPCPLSATFGRHRQWLKHGIHIRPPYHPQAMPTGRQCRTIQTYLWHRRCCPTSMDLSFWTASLRGGLDVCVRTAHGRPSDSLSSVTAAPSLPKGINSQGSSGRQALCNADGPCPGQQTDLGITTRRPDLICRLNPPLLRPISSKPYTTWKQRVGIARPGILHVCEEELVHSFQSRITTIHS